MSNNQTEGELLLLESYIICTKDCLKRLSIKSSLQQFTGFKVHPANLNLSETMNEIRLFFKNGYKEVGTVCLFV